MEGGGVCRGTNGIHRTEAWSSWSLLDQCRGWGFRVAGAQSLREEEWVRDAAEREAGRGRPR